MRALIAACVLLGGMAVAVAADKADPTGTWKWSQEFNGKKFERTLKLKLEGDKLTGSMPGRKDQETAIEDGAFKDGTVSFQITRERDGKKLVTKYSAKLEGDTLKGTAESERDGQTRKQEFEAKREK